MRPTIYIDADACPVTSETLAVARKNALPAVVAGNATQNLARHIRRGDPREPRDGFWVDTLPVGIGADAADFAIVQELEPGDIVVTQDYGLAALCLARAARVLDQNGRVYDESNIDALLSMRHLSARARRAGGRVKGPPKRRPQQDEAFRLALEEMLDGAGKTALHP